LREEKYGTMEEYPNPLSVTVLLLTADGKLVLGIKQGPDQGNRLHAVGGGFISLVQSSAVSSEVEPEHPVDTAIRECQEETNLESGVSFNPNDVRIIGMVFGDNHDSSCVAVIPLNVEGESIALGSNEHSALFLYDTDSKSLQNLIDSRYLLEVPDSKATDHLILALQLLQRYMKRRT
jgi:ADP-ribose pyrophosphatase YjhB (NUDIX family)